VTRRNALLRALSRYLPQATVLGAAAGVHLTVQFPGYANLTESQIVAGVQALAQAMR
jgi:GntR family transcriptional regulator / MocR family aminotransferase